MCSSCVRSLTRNLRGSIYILVSLTMRSPRQLIIKALILGLRLCGELHKPCLAENGEPTLLGVQKMRPDAQRGFVALHRIVQLTKDLKAEQKELFNSRGPEGRAKRIVQLTEDLEAEQKELLKSPKA